MQESSKTSLRVIKSKGRLYIQRVRYEWDPKLKRGKTIVIKHIAPFIPMNPARYKDINLNKLRFILQKKPKRRYDGPQQTKTHLPQNLKHEEEKQGKQEKPQLLIPNQELIDRVLDILSDSHEWMSRIDVFRIFIQRFKNVIESETTIKTQIGFALTILSRRGNILRKGSGKRYDPFQYFMPEKV